MFFNIILASLVTIYYGFVVKNNLSIFLIVKIRITYSLSIWISKQTCTTISVLLVFDGVSVFNV